MTKTRHSLNYSQVICLFLVVLGPNSIVECNDSPKLGIQAPPGPRKLPKDPLYITDMDLENLYDQWEEADDEKLPPDELEPHKRPSKPMKFPKGKAKEDLFNDPEKLMQASKKGKTVMMFVSVAGNPTKEKTEELTQRWQLGLTNNHIKCERYVIADDRAIYVFLDGILAFEAKDFFLEQPELKELSIDQRTWHGKGFPNEYPHAKEKKADSGKRRDEL